MREGGGTAWLSTRRARLEDKSDEEHDYPLPRIPDLLDTRFASVLQGLNGQDDQGVLDSAGSLPEHPFLQAYQSHGSSNLRQWCVVGDVQSPSSIEAETASLIQKVTSLLQKTSLSPASIISTTIALRNMADFPTINKIYGSLFNQPNPPSRVTISCGDLLPPNCNIAVYLSVHHNLTPGTRQGLHVQSRSYWAPANIGPYSQAISIPISSLSSSQPSTTSGPTAALVHIAGQIPLLPATMSLPTDSLNSQAGLSLQHLWRIGTETGVQWWSSAVAYLPHTPDDPVAAKQAALLASRTWRAAHAWAPEAAEDDDSGPDLWDRTHDPRYMSFAADDAAGPKTLPDRSVLEDDDRGLAVPTPAFFAAVVAELPRRAGVEWHAHLGFAKLDDGSVRVVALDSEMVQVQHTVLRPDERGVFVHTVLAVKRLGSQTEKTSLPDVLRELQTLYLARMGGLVGVEGTRGLGDVAPAHLYVHCDVVAVGPEDVGRDGCPVIPCFSLWNAKVEEVTAVAVYQEWLDRKS